MMPIRRQLIVGYSYPTDPAWQLVYDNADDIFAVIVNPNSGVGAEFDPNYETLCRRLTGLGIKIVGYVSTRYGSRPIDEVRKEMSTWTTWYKVDGYFLDESATDETSLTYYRRLRSVAGIGLVIQNPGTVPSKAYLDTADIICIAETDQASYVAKTFPPWVHGTDAERFYHIVYDVTDPALVLGQITANNGGYVYLASVPGPDPQFSVDTTVFIKTVAPVNKLRDFSNDQLIEELRRRLGQG